MFVRRGSPEFRRRERVPLDSARRARYAALLRRWMLERTPADAFAVAASWIETALKSAELAGESTPEDESLLVRLRTRLIADRPKGFRAEVPCMRAAHRAPTSRVEQLVGRDRLDAWEHALGALPRRQRELAILRVEFGLDDASIATEANLPVAIARAQTVNALAALIDALGYGSKDRAA